MNKLYIILLTSLMSASMPMAFGMDSRAIIKPARAKRDRAAIATENKARAENLLEVLYGQDLPLVEGQLALEAQKHGAKLIRKLLEDEAENKRNRTCPDMPHCKECKQIFEEGTYDMVRIYAPSVQLQFLRDIRVSQAEIEAFAEKLYNNKNQ